MLAALILACAPKTAAPTPSGFADEGTGTSVADGVQDFLVRTEPQIIECYMATLEDPSKADDSVQLQFVIDAGGKVSRVVARQSTITDVRFMDCVEKCMEIQKVVNPTGNTLAVTRDYNFRPAK